MALAARQKLSSGEAREDVSSARELHDATTGGCMRQYFVVLAILLSIGIAFGQTFGSIAGAVTDPSGTVVPNAQITVTNTATGVSRSTKTDSAGIYEVPDLVPGPYAVKVTMSGFEPMTSSLLIQVQQAARVDFALVVGQASQSIQVSSTAAVLNTENVTVGTVIENQRIVDLPLNGRDYFQLVALAPNVTYGFAPASQAASREGGSVPQSRFRRSASGRHGRITRWTASPIPTSTSTCTFCCRLWTRSRSLRYKAEYTPPNLAARRAK